MRRRWAILWQACMWPGQWGQCCLSLDNSAIFDRFNRVLVECLVNERLHAPRLSLDNSAIFDCFNRVLLECLVDERLQAPPPRPARSSVEWILVIRYTSFIKNTTLCSRVCSEWQLFRWIATVLKAKCEHWAHRLSDEISYKEYWTSDSKTYKNQ
jgi:hypothetical protein